MKNEVSLKWKSDMAFEGIVNNHKITVDADESVGGHNSGPRPKPLMLLALAGCTAMDVVAILKKMKVDLEDFNVVVSAELTEEHPKVYKSMHIVYQFKGNDLDPEKLKKAIDLSQEKYCGVSAMYKNFANITFEMQIL